MKYTSGPWEYWKANNFEGYAIAQKGTLATLAGVYNFPEETEGNACLISAAPELLKEHKKWANILGYIFVRALQHDYEVLQLYAKTMKLDYINGNPVVKSEAIAKAEGK